MIRKACNNCSAVCSDKIKTKLLLLNLPICSAYESSSIDMHMEDTPEDTPGDASGHSEEHYLGFGGGCSSGASSILLKSFGYGMSLGASGEPGNGVAIGNSVENEPIT